ncbi:MAG TPA: gluconate 2-dehydrogenase subunit 3 family protein [Alloacidobacterium sp.]|nr:gluconate 2-dehydrogenase subunit 3 family protein [Alloacidobacterium sp.]
MRRRDFVKGFVAVSAAAKSVLAQQATQVAPSTPPPVPTAPGPVPWMRGLNEMNRVSPDVAAVPDAIAQTSARFFSGEQMVTLRRLCEILVPPHKGYPGAIDAGVPEFLDFLVGASPADRQRSYQNGLDWLDAESKKKFGVAFVDAQPAQIDQLIRPWLRTWMSDHPPTEDHAYFINIAHSDIRTATVNSKAWSDAAKAEGERSPNMGVYWFPVEPDMRRECAQPAAHATKKHRA